VEAPPPPHARRAVTGARPQIARAVFEALLAISRRGTTILLVEQNARLALRVAQHAAILEAGRVVLEGTSRELEEHPDVREAYPGTGGARERGDGRGARLRKSQIWKQAL
jgi:ABC-type multidrug transport system ATPase subunit